jgi:Cytochrome P460
MKTWLSLASVVLVVTMAMNWSSAAQERSTDAPAFSSAGELQRPADYRDWVFLTSGLGMTYGPAQADAGGHQMFDNVFVTRDAHREFLRSGTWPDRTMFILELREAQANVSINNGGRTQGPVMAMEAAVKDRKRFPDGGWAYFSFSSRNGLTASAAPLPAKASCYSCHRDNTAVDNTFVQFYPTLFEVAKRLGTIKPTYDPARKP